MLPEILRLLRSGKPRTPLLVHLVIPVGLRLLVDEIPNHPDIPWRRDATKSARINELHAIHVKGRTEKNSLMRCGTEGENWSPP